MRVPCYSCCANRSWNVVVLYEKQRLISARTFGASANGMAPAESTEDDHIWWYLVDTPALSPNSKHKHTYQVQIPGRLDQM